MYFASKKNDPNKLNRLIELTLAQMESTQKGFADILDEIRGIKNLLRRLLKRLLILQASSYPQLGASSTMPSATMNKRQKEKQQKPLSDVIQKIQPPPNNEQENDHWILARNVPNITTESLRAMRNKKGAEKCGPFTRDSTGRISWKPEEGSTKIFYNVESLNLKQLPNR